MNESEFRTILVRVRDRLLARMRSEGFWHERRLRRDATPWDVNNGYCDEFADGVMAEVYGQSFEPEDMGPNDPYVVDLATFDEDLAHCAVRWRGKFYDAECVSGVRSWRRLPIVVNRGKSRSQALKSGWRCQE